ncbi:MFS transporter [Nonomuraea sp. NPDC049646]|uniref:MFS transporter n=1 Tax=unclassified Nonomuraea TaxID=2593643 RepID=UPI003791FA3D
MELRGLGAAAWDLSAVPAGKVAALARFAKAARAKAVADLAGDRKLATLVAFAAVMEPVSADEAIEVFDLAMGDLVRTSAFKAGKERLRTTAFPEGPRRTRAIAVWTAVSLAGGTAGNLIGGALTEYLSWRWILLVNVPIGLACLAATRALPGGPARGLGQRLDVVGALLATGGLATLAYSLSGPRVLTAASIAAAAAVLLGLFVLVEARLARAPLLPPRLLRPRPIWLGNLAMLMAGATLNPMWYFLTLSLQHVLGYGPLQTGLAFLPHTLLTILVGLRLTPWLMRRADHRVLIAAGALIGAAGFLWQSRLAPGQDYVTAILGPAMLISLGGGLLNTPLTVTVTSGVPAQDAGAASGLMNTAKQIGGALGLAALATATAGHNGESGSPAQTQAQELAAGFGQAFVAIAVTLAAVALLAAALPKRPHAAAPGEPADWQHAP